MIEIKRVILRHKNKHLPFGHDVYIKNKLSKKSSNKHGLFY